MENGLDKSNSGQPQQLQQAQQPQSIPSEQVQIILGAMERQRNNAFNDAVNMEVQMIMMKNRIDQLEKIIKDAGLKLPVPIGQEQQQQQGPRPAMQGDAGTI